MTLLQRGVIQRLREAGFTELADLAREHWQAGERIPGGVRPGTDAPRFRELLEDFDRANAQAAPNQPPGEPFDANSPTPGARRPR